MLELSANDPIIKAYLKDIQRLKEGQLVMHELGLKGPFQNLLDKAAKKRGWTLVPELSTYSGGKRVVPDGTVRDEFRLARGWWEAMAGPVFRIAATLYWAVRRPLKTLRRTPQNWLRQSLCTDFFHPPEIVPMDAARE